MGLADRLRHLDARAVGSLRQPGEPAEAFLRRLADRRWPQSRPMLSEIQQQALRDYFHEQNAR